MASLLRFLRKAPTIRFAEREIARTDASRRDKQTALHDRLLKNYSTLSPEQLEEGLSFLIEQNKLHKVDFPHLGESFNAVSIEKRPGYLASAGVCIYDHSGFFKRPFFIEYKPSSLFGNGRFRVVESAKYIS